MKKKIWLLIPLLAAIVAVIWYISPTQWTRDFDLKYVEYVNKGGLTESSDYSYYLYEITNTTNRTLKDISVVISIDNPGSSDWTYEDSVAHRIRPGETVEYKLFVTDYKKAAEELNEPIIGFIEVDIVKIKYSK